MANKEKLYYKIAGKAKDSDEVYFSNTRIQIKTEALTRAFAIGMTDFAEQDTHSINRRMNISFIETSLYNQAREEIGLQHIVPEGDKNDYITIYSSNDEMILMLRPTSVRTRTILEFEEWEARNKRNFEAQQKYEKEQFEKNLGI